MFNRRGFLGRLLATPLAYYLGVGDVEPLVELEEEAVVIDSGVIVRGAFAQLLAPGLKKQFEEMYNVNPHDYEMLFDYDTDRYIFKLDRLDLFNDD